MDGLLGVGERGGVDWLQGWREGCIVVGPLRME